MEWWVWLLIILGAVILLGVLMFFIVRSVSSSPKSTPDTPADGGAYGTNEFEKAQGGGGGGGYPASPPPPFMSLMGSLTPGPNASGMALQNAVMQWPQGAHQSSFGTPYPQSSPYTTAEIDGSMMRANADESPYMITQKQLRGDVDTPELNSWV